MVNAIIYIEGSAKGPNSKDQQSACREAFKTLLSKACPEIKLPRLKACGGRDSAFDDFCIAHKQGKLKFVAMLIDSEETVKGPSKPWDHLRQRESDKHWKRPPGATDEQVLFMTTCMETWIIADIDALRSHYRSDCLQLSSLPALNNLENVSRQDVQEGLENATRNCANAYRKGKRSFEILGKLNPETLTPNLPSFRRICRILDEKL